MIFRWFGDHDPVTLAKIRQIPVIKGIVSTLTDIPTGEVWPQNRVIELKEQVEKEKLKLSVIESIPIHEDIKSGKKSRDKYIENYCTSIRNVSETGVEVIVYNFMPIFDCTRSNYYHPNPDGSSSMIYEHKNVQNLNVHEKSDELPVWARYYKQKELDALLDDYKNVDEKQLWKNLQYFLESVIPVAEECGIKMAIHPDDPPWAISGLPRIINSAEAIKRVIKLVDSPANGISLCTGSLGANRSVKLSELVKYLIKKDRLPFIHIRNIKYLNGIDFKETSHISEKGDLDIKAIVKVLAKNDFNGFIRPDHGRQIWGEKSIPGYGLNDRALGAMYLYGLWDAYNN